MGDERNAGGGNRAVAELAEQQHGVVSRGQLRERGLSDRMIATRVASGWLHPVLRGVFAVGHRGIGRRGEMFAAVLACGDDAVVSHESAAELLGLWKRGSAPVDVIGGGQAGRKLEGVHWHRPPLLGPEEITVRNGIPCTTASRTIVDLAGMLGKGSLRRAVEQAAVLRLLDVGEIDRVLEQGRRQGAPQLRRILKAWRSGEELPKLRSGIEARVLAACVEARLPRPRCNVELRLDGKRLEVDLLWKEQRVVVEADGTQTHGTHVAFQRDRWRDQLLAANGYRAVRVTWEQLETEKTATMRRIRRMLGKRRESTSKGG